MRHSFLFFLFFSLLCCQCSSPEESEAQYSGELNAFQEIIVDHSKKMIHPAEISMALIHENEVQFIGIQRIGDRLNWKSNEDLIFEAGSITKVFTSTLLAYFEYEGKVSPEERLEEHLPFPMKVQATIHLRDLASHSSGLPRLPANLMLSSIFNSSNPYKKYDEEKLAKYLSEDLKLKYKPKSEQLYSNLGLGVLGYTLSRLSDQELEDLFQQYFFDPLGMSHSSLHRDKLKAKPVRGYKESKKTTSYWDFDVLAGLGALKSSSKDLASFIQAHFEAKDSALMHSQTLIYEKEGKSKTAFGWFIKSREEGQDWYWHNGGTGGFSSCMVMDPKQKLGVVVLSNQSAIHPASEQIDPLSFALMEALIEEKEASSQVKE